VASKPAASEDAGAAKIKHTHANGKAAANGKQPPAGGKAQAFDAGAVPWVPVGKAVAREYDEARAEARDHARVRNACFHEATRAYLAGAWAALRWPGCRRRRRRCCCCCWAPGGPRPPGGRARVPGGAVAALPGSPPQRRGLLLWLTRRCPPARPAHTAGNKRQAKELSAQGKQAAAAM
jgi:hypothetical protein